MTFLFTWEALIIEGDSEGWQFFYWNWLATFSLSSILFIISLVLMVIGDSFEYEEQFEGNQVSNSYSELHAIHRTDFDSRRGPTIRG